LISTSRRRAASSFGDTVPTQHLVELIGKPEKGENFYRPTVRRLGDANKVMATTVVVGKKTEADKSDRKRRRWPSSRTNTGRSTSPI